MLYFGCIYLVRAGSTVVVLNTPNEMKIPKWKFKSCVYTSVVLDFAFKGVLQYPCFPESVNMNHLKACTKVRELD